MRLIELQQRVHKLVSNARAIRDKAESEGRTMTTKEVGRVNAMLDEVEGLDQEIMDVRMAEERERRLGAAPGTRAVPSLANPNVEGSLGTSRDLSTAHALRSDERMVDWARTNNPDDASEYADLEVGSFMRAMVCGPRNDVERRALSEGTDSAGGFTVPSITSSRVIDNLRAATQVLKAGAQVVPLTSDSTTIARIASDATVEWLAENATQTASDPTFAGVVFAPKTLRALVRCSRELIEDSVNIEQALTKMFVGALSVELDRVALYGTGTPPEPEGVKNMTGIGHVEYDANGTPMLDSTIYPAILDAMYEVEVDNAGPVSGLIMAPRTSRDLNKLVETAAASYQPLQAPDAVAKLPKYVTSSIPIDETDPGTTTNSSTIFAGRWDNLFVGMRTNLRIEVLKERYADSFQIGFLAFLRADVQAAHVEAFSELVGVEPRA